MLLRVRVSLPDRPGSLGQVARTLGVAGADIVQMVVLERQAGRAIDDFTVLWPGAATVPRLLAGLDAAPGVRLHGVWAVTAAASAGEQDAQVLAQLAANPASGLTTLVDAVPGLLAADWAAVAAVPADWAGGRPGEAVVLRASWQTHERVTVPELTPIRPRAIEGRSGEQFAAAPFGRDGLVLLAARVRAQHLPPAAFHRTEVGRLSQLVRAATAVLDGCLREETALSGADDPPTRRVEARDGENQAAVPGVGHVRSSVPSRERAPLAAASDGGDQSTRRAGAGGKDHDTVAGAGHD